MIDSKLAIGAGAVEGLPVVGTPQLISIDESAT
jgi:hypothetical protein